MVAPLAALAFVAACGGDTTSPASQLARIELRHPTRIVTVGEQIAIEVFAFDQVNTRVKAPSLEWTSDAPAVATVDSVGRVTGHGIGDATIRATSEGVQGTISIAVRAAVLSIVVHQGSPNLVVGETAVLKAVARDDVGNTIPVRRPFTWATGDAGVVSLTSVPGLDAAHVLVTARSTGLASLSVGTDEMQSHYIVAVVPEPVPADSPVRVSDFYFFTHWGEYFAYLPTLQVVVAPGRTAQMVRVEVAIPGMQPRLLPALCSSGRLTSGVHGLLGASSYPSDVFSWYSFFAVSDADGAALLTYRGDDGRLITTAVRGTFDHWGYGSGYATQFPWEVCTA